MINSKAGFTLIEVIISIAIIGIITLSLLSAFAVGFRWIADSGERSQNAFISQEALEQDLINGGSSTAANMVIIFEDSDGNQITTQIDMNGEDINDGSLWLFIPETD